MNTSKNTANTFAHILCLVDGSEAGCRAAKRAAHLARELDAKLSFLAVGTKRLRDEGFEQYARLEGVTDPIPPAHEQETLDCLNAAIAIATEAGVVHAGQLEATGDVITAICRNAVAHRVDLVVLRRQKSGLLDWLLGDSVSDRIAKDCNFAVLSIR